MRTQKKAAVEASPRHRLLARSDAMLGVSCMPLPSECAAPVETISSTVLGDSLDDLQREVEAAFPFSESLSAATACVFGEGDPNSSLVFVGEAPGADEDRQGRPFVGPAGRKLDEIIKAMGLEREEVYICNVLKARPPGNRNPLPDEVAQATPWLYEQLRRIRPSVIVALGGPASKLLLQTHDGITRLRGHMGVWQDPEGDLEIPVMPTFHPAFLLRNYTAEVRGQMWQDMQAVMALLAH